MKVKLFDSISDAFDVLNEHEPRLVKSGNKNICIVRLNNKLIAFLNECPHQGESLHRGVVNYLGEIVCPLHAYRFNLMTGASDNNRCRDLTLIRVTVTDAVYLEV